MLDAPSFAKHTCDCLPGAPPGSQDQSHVSPSTGAQSGPVVVGVLLPRPSTLEGVPGPCLPVREDHCDPNQLAALS